MRRRCSLKSMSSQSAAQQFQSFRGQVALCHIEPFVSVDSLPCGQIEPPDPRLAGRDVHKADQASGDRGIHLVLGSETAHPQSTLNPYVYRSFSHRNRLHTEGTLVDRIAIRIAGVLRLRIEVGQQLPDRFLAGFPTVPDLGRGVRQQQSPFRGTKHGPVLAGQLTPRAPIGAARYRVKDHRVHLNRGRGRLRVRRYGGASGLDGKSSRHALKKAIEHLGLGRFGDLKTFHRPPIARHNVNVHIAGSHSPGGEVAINPLPFRLFGRRSFAAPRVVFVGRVNRNVAAVQKVDYFGIRERTRPHGKCPPSTAAGFDSPIVGEEKQRAVEGTSKPLRFQNSVCPADIVNPPLGAAWLELADPLLYPIHQVFVVRHPGGKQSDSSENRGRRLEETPISDPHRPWLPRLGTACAICRRLFIIPNQRSLHISMHCSSANCDGARYGTRWDWQYRSPGKDGYSLPGPRRIYKPTWIIQHGGS